MKIQRVVASAVGATALLLGGASTASASPARADQTIKVVSYIENSTAPTPTTTTVQWDLFAHHAVIGTESADCTYTDTTHTLGTCTGVIQLSGIGSIDITATPGPRVFRINGGGSGTGDFSAVYGVSGLETIVVPGPSALTLHVKGADLPHTFLHSLYAVSHDPLRPDSYDITLAEPNPTTISFTADDLNRFKLTSHQSVTCVYPTPNFTPSTPANCTFIITFIDGSSLSGTAVSSAVGATRAHHGRHG